MTYEPLEPFGPAYNVTGVDKWRRLSRKRELTAAEMDEYGRAVLAAVLKAQAAAARRYVAPMTVHCASGTPYNDGKQILAALRRKSVPPISPEASAVLRKHLTK